MAVHVWARPVACPHSQQKACPQRHSTRLQLCGGKGGGQCERDAPTSATLLLISVPRCGSTPPCPLKPMPLMPPTLHSSPLACCTWGRAWCWHSASCSSRCRPSCAAGQGRLVGWVSWWAGNNGAQGGGVAGPHLFHIIAAPRPTQRKPGCLPSLAVPAHLLPVAQHVAGAGGVRHLAARKAELVPARALHLGREVGRQEHQQISWGQLGVGWASYKLARFWPTYPSCNATIAELAPSPSHPTHLAVRLLAADSVAAVRYAGAPLGSLVVVDVRLCTCGSGAMKKGAEAAS